MGSSERGFDENLRRRRHRGCDSTSVRRGGRRGHGVAVVADDWGPAKSERDDVWFVVVVDFVALGDMVDDVEVVVVSVDAVVDRVAVAFVDVIVDEANVGVTGVDA